MAKKRKRNEINSKKNAKKKSNSLGIGFFIIPLIVLIFLYAFIFSVTEDWKCYYISPVFKNYEPLEKTDDSDEKLENYFSDEAGVLYEDESPAILNDSAKYFYEKTGVKIYLYSIGVAEDGNGGYIYPSKKEMQETCEKVCKELSHEGIDMVLLFLTTPEGYISCTYATDEVRNNYGKKCENIVEQYLLYNFNVVGEYDTLFRETYKKSADRLMGGFTSPLAVVKENLRFVILFATTAIIAGLFGFIYFRNGKKNKFAS